MSDYETLPISRKELEKIASQIRKAFGCTDPYFFDVIDALEKIPAIFKDRFTVDYEIVDDDELAPNVPACCDQQWSDWTFTIRIKNSVYEGAAKRNVGGDRAHIAHEISHVFLVSMGFGSINSIEHREGKLEPYRSMEWQAKALSGYLLVPRATCADLSPEEIVDKCCVSMDMAKTMYNIYHMRN